MEHWSVVRRVINGLETTTHYSNSPALRTMPDLITATVACLPFAEDPQPGTTPFFSVCDSGRAVYPETVMGSGNQPRVVIVGPGAIGCLFACLLARSGFRVSLLDKYPGRARLLSERGISLEEGGISRIKIPVFAEPGSVIDDCDVLIVCVKAFDTRAAVRHAMSLVKNGTTVVSLQNGLGNLEAIAEHVPPGRVVCAVTGHGATSLAPGSVRHAGSGITRVAPFVAEGMHRARAVAEIIGSAGLEAESLPDVETVRWSKLIVNAAVNPLSAIHNVPNGSLARDPELLEYMRLAAGEGQRVAVSKGVGLLYADAASETERVCRETAGNLSSRLQDVRRRRRTEIDAINGAIVRTGSDLGIATPVNAELTDAIHRIEESYSDAA